MIGLLAFVRIRYLQWLGLCIACCIIAGGCRTKGNIVATLEKFNGQVERNAASKATWQGAPEGTIFTIGDAVRTRAKSSAELKLFDKSNLSLEPNTLVRFLAKGTGQKHTHFDLEMGQATLEAAGETLNYDMQVGTAMIEAHGKVRLVRSGNATRFEVVIGAARLLTDKESIELRVGDAVEIAPDHSLLRTPASSSSPSQPEPPSIASADAGDSALPVASMGNMAPGNPEGTRTAGPEVVDFVANAGESFVIHDPKPPTVVGLLQSKCPGAAIFRLNPERPKPKETQGTARLSMSVPVGLHRYAVICLKPDGREGERTSQGTIAVLADDGSRRLAKSAPVSNVDTDGRRYTVLYQGHLPGLAVHWPNPPTATSFTLSVHSNSGAARTFTASSANYTLPSGSLPEGEHVLTFEGGGRRSKPTNVVLRFDNAAPTASISSPSDGSFSQGSSVLVSGTALPGWNVSISGQELTQDGQNRFSQEVVAPSGQRALWIRFSQAGRGVHYYLRRSGQ